MVSDGAGAYTVLDNGTTLADVPFEVAHEFVHQGCLLCAIGEDHTAPGVHLLEIA
jgi:hypothetical protein